MKVFDSHSSTHKVNVHHPMLKRLYATLILLLSLSPLAFASHYFGSSLTYECVAPDTFKIWHTEYMDCAGINSLPPNLNFTGIGSGCAAPSYQSNWTLASTAYITPVSPSFPTTCTGGSAPGVREVRYYKTVAFSTGSCSKYTVSWALCCRAGIAVGGPTSYDYYQRIDTLLVTPGFCNSSPQWNAQGLVFITVGHNGTYDQGATDADGDSIVYRLVAPMTSATTTLPYPMGYSPTQPLGSSWTFSLDAQTGLLSVSSTPGTAVANYMAIVAEEWRGGVKIGQIYRETLVAAINGTATCIGNNEPLPSYSSPTNGMGAPYYALAGDTFHVQPNAPNSILIQATDPDLSNATQIVWLGGLPSGQLRDMANVPTDTVMGINPTAIFALTPTPGIYTTYFGLLDTACNYTSMVVFPITFVATDSALVWPGDANSDLIANFLDLFSIGLSYGDTGPARQGATNAWTGQWASTWLDSTFTGIDKKHQDCNGDAIVDASDVVPILLNYGLTHTKNRSAARGTATDPHLTLNLPATASVGDTITATITLGDINVQANNIYGLGFQIAYDATLFDTVNVALDFSPSWLGNSSNSITLEYNQSSQALCDGAQVRTDHTTASGDGLIATATFIIIDNIDGKRAQFDSAMANIYFTEVHLIGLEGEVIPVNPVGDSILIYQLSVERPTSQEAHAPIVAPVPATDEVRVLATGQSILDLTVLDLSGKQLLTRTGNHQSTQRLGLETLPSGLYLLQIHTDQGTHTQRLVVE